MPRFKVWFSYTEGGSILVLAPDAEIAERMVMEEMEMNGVENISCDQSYSTDHKNYDVYSVEEVKSSGSKQ